MYENFDNLPEEKRKKIMDASIEEFARNGYEKASTNNIVKAAGISKGILFHYFGSKKNLFLYLVDNVMQYFIDKFYSISTSPSPDIFDRLMERGLVKLKMAYDDPVKYEFIFNAFINTPEELNEEIKQRYNSTLSKNLGAFYANLDTSKFREDIDSKKAIEVVVTFLEGHTNKYINLYRNHKAEDIFNDIDSLLNDFNQYFDILKKGIYKQDK